jgi:hypothetical protein
MKGIVLGAAAVAGGALVYRQIVHPWWRTWGVDERDVTRGLPGDDLVPNAPTVDTRSIEIDAPPSDVWPWLVQMGYGRAGWYSYDSIDMAGASSRDILPAWQALEVGDVVPTHPGGGFEVRVIDPDRSLVLFYDTKVVARQAEAVDHAGKARTAMNVQATGTVLAATQPADFAASWAFILEPLPGDRCRLIERIRVHFGTTDKPWTVLTLPVVGFGVFLMTQRQMVGIRDRAEALARSRGSETSDLVEETPQRRPESPSLATVMG